MTLHTCPTSYPVLELNFSASGSVPDAIEILPRGPEFSGRDGRVFRLKDAAAFVAAFNEAGQPVVIDIDHASESEVAGTIAPAMGWVEDLELRDGAVWGRVRWTDAGRTLMEAQAYRYVSPTIWTHKVTREVVGLSSVALVHKPNLALKALNSRNEETDTMDKAILEALGLDANATAADAVMAIGTLKGEREKALNSAQHPDPEAFVPRADYELVTNRLTEVEALAEAAAEKEMNAVIDAGIAAEKIAPASRDYHLATCKAVGVEKFADLLGKMPAQFTARPETNALKQPGGQNAPDEAVLAVCKMMGTDPQVHMAFAAKEKEA